MNRIEIIRGFERRRRWSIEQKLAILAEAGRPGISVSEVARRHDLHASQVFKWRRQARLGELMPVGSAAIPGFVPVALGADPPSISLVSPLLSPLAGGDLPGHFEVHLANGRVARFREDVPPDGLRGLGMLLEGMDWRMPQRTWRPKVAG